MRAPQVRNPVEVLVSGFLYHRRGPPDEKWLWDPVKELGGTPDSVPGARLSWVPSCISSILIWVLWVLHVDVIWVFWVLHVKLFC